LATRTESADLSEQRVQQLVKEGMPRESRGQYDPMKCMFWYIRYLQTAIERRTTLSLDGEHPGGSHERVRLLRASAELKEMELAKQRSQLIAVSDAEASVTDLVVTTRSHVMAIPARLAPELVGETSRVMIQAKIEKAVKETLRQLARSYKDGRG
jgi:phage terminase Nu1 subunit (DNA packaging protein)